jgi:CRISPR/Cas system-associated exonuclease Cas4 (RecB family)
LQQGQNGRKKIEKGLKFSIVFKLSPSDFKYLWEECPHCFYRKVHYNIRQPSIGIPSIFTRMSSLLQVNIQNKNLQDFVPHAPSGIFILKEGYLKSKPLPSGKSYINGRFDLLVKFADGTFGVIDVKMTDSKDEDLDKFDRQLHAYKYALENPAEGEPIFISKVGLLVVSPTDIKPHGGFFYYKAKPIWKDIPINMDNFFSFIKEVENLLEGPEPPPSQNCEWCQYKHGS